MEEQAEQESQEEKILAIQNKIKSEITPHVLEIQKLLDTLTAFIGKETYQDAEHEGAFDVMDAIREESDAIEELLLSLRDTIR